jgi:hypothetical protein
MYPPNDFQDIDTDLLSVRKLAEVLDCSPKTVRDWLYKDRKHFNPGPLPYYRLNGLLRFRLNEVKVWIDRRRVRVAGVHFTKLH